MKVEVSIVAGFMALLNVAVITAVLGQTRVEPASGVAEVTTGRVKGLPGVPGGAGAAGFPGAAFLSESPHPVIATAKNNAEIQILLTFTLCISFSCSTGDWV